VTQMTTVESADVAPGCTVVVRDEEWLVTSVEQTPDGHLLHVQGLGDLVRGTTATFYDSLDTIELLDPARATLTGDGSPHYRLSKLWLEATLRKTAVPIGDPALTVSTGMLADPLAYQQSAVRKALDPANLRPRILLADAVGLGKTLEIGMILAELVRRGRGERILIVSPRHVLEQMQHEMWSRFALPFVRLDSVGVQRVKQKLPASRNPFTYYKRVIVSIDTLKQDRFANDLRGHRWDAIVIDESHNITNSATQNNRLARILAPNTDALILASATPHNGKAESFAELIRLLEPTAVSPDGTVDEDEVRRLVVRRHRNSPEVANVVAADWAERREPHNVLIPASPEEDAVAGELDRVWLHPPGPSPYSGQASTLFPWTLAKAFLSSPAALRQTIAERIRRLGHAPTPDGRREIDALERLQHLNDQSYVTRGGKYTALVAYLRKIGVGRHSDMRAVVFAERVATLTWLQHRLREDFGMSEEQVEILHGGLDDVRQQEVVESFKKATSPIRILVTGDVASEGVNLHRQCHELIHYDIPWSLIRLEQRNGRIDRYGQKVRPQITALLLEPSAETFRGDLRVLTKLMEKEAKAHQALGDAASLMGKFSVEAEEEAIKEVLAGQKDLDEEVRDADDVVTDNSVAGMLARLSRQVDATPTTADRRETTGRLYPSEIAFLQDALDEAFGAPGLPPDRNGVSFREYPNHTVEFVPPRDLAQRLEVLPQSYLADRRVLADLKLVTTTERGTEELTRALNDRSGSTWPEAHYLGPLHPVLDWAADRALASLARNQIFAIRGSVTAPTFLLLGTLTNRRGQVISRVFLSEEFAFYPAPTPAFGNVYEDARAMLEAVGVTGTLRNPGAPADLNDLQQLVPIAVQEATREMAVVIDAATDDVQRRVEAWTATTRRWLDTFDAEAPTTRAARRRRRAGVDKEQDLLRQMEPSRRLIRPLLLVLPADHPVAPRTVREG